MLSLDFQVRCVAQSITMWVILGTLLYLHVEFLNRQSAFFASAF